LRCMHKEGKAVIDVKRRTEAHITKYHLRLGECAHNCRLCFPVLGPKDLGKPCNILPVTCKGCERAEC
jgi:hypothetical protein